MLEILWLNKEYMLMCREHIKISEANLCDFKSDFFHDCILTFISSHTGNACNLELTLTEK